MKSTTVTVERMDLLFLNWNSRINASGLYREAMWELMEDHDVAPHGLRGLVERAEDAGYDLDDIAEETDRFDDLAELVEDAREIAT